jgi:hypothetical protein
MKRKDEKQRRKRSQKKVMDIHIFLVIYNTAYMEYSRSRLLHLRVGASLFLHEGGPRIEGRERETRDEIRKDKESAS